MFRFLFEKRAPLLAALLMLSSLLLMSTRIRVPTAGEHIETAVLALLSPFLRGGSSVVGAGGGIYQRYVGLRGMEQDNARLRSEVDALKQERQRLEEAERENARLRGLLDMKEALTLPAVPARVISLELSDPFRVAILDKGSRDGVARDDAVLTPDGVVGRVTAVTERLAKVQLVVDPSSAVGALVERTRVQGMVVGRAVNRLEMQYVTTGQDVAASDMVDTAGLDGIYPRGLRLGMITDVRREASGAQQITLLTAVDFRRLEEVLVVRVRTALEEDADAARAAGVWP
jgi:rod shape-determining protein MreC